MRPASLARLALLALLVPLAGCGRVQLALGGQLEDSVLADGGPDAAGMDAGTDAARVADAGTDAAPVADAGTNPAPDAAPDTDADTDIDTDAGTEPDSGTPPPPPVTGTPTAVFAGADSTCALISDGRVACWGRNDAGQLATTPRNTAQCDRCEPAPVEIPALAGATQIALSDTHGCALIGQRVSCFGGNMFGELGRNSADRAAHPEPVDVGLDNVAQIVVGRSFSCARLTTNELHCWGLGVSGQLGVSPAGLGLCDVPPERVMDLDIEGRGSEIPCARTPQQVPSIAALSVSAGDTHVCVLVAGGGVTCWGSNRFGQIGNGVQSNSSAQYTTSLTGVTSISLGGVVSCALGAGGMQCFGSNRYGLMGLGLAPNVTPIVTSPMATGGALSVQHVRAGSDHICVLDASNLPHCAGANENGQLGHTSVQSCVIAGIATPCSTAFTAAAGSVPMTQIATGNSHTCGITSTAELVCFGDNRTGQLGVPGATPGATPRTALAP